VADKGFSQLRFFQLNESSSYLLLFCFCFFLFLFLLFILLSLSLSLSRLFSQLCLTPYLCTFNNATSGSFYDSFTTHCALCGLVTYFHNWRSSLMDLAVRLGLPVRPGRIISGTGRRVTVRIFTSPEVHRSRQALTVAFVT